MAATTGVDALPTILHSENEQLRASAIARLSTIRQEIAAAVAAADESFRAKEQECLEAVALWRRAATSQERAAAALVVGGLQRELAKLDEARQVARYPHRFIQERKLQRSVIDADTRDERVIQHPVLLLRPFTSDVAQRTIALS
jgi:hypothetical protein